MNTSIQNHACRVASHVRVHKCFPSLSKAILWERYTSTTEASAGHDEHMCVGDENRRTFPEVIDPIACAVVGIATSKHSLVSPCLTGH